MSDRAALAGALKRINRGLSHELALNDWQQLVDGERAGAVVILADGSRWAPRDTITAA